MFSKEKLKDFVAPWQVFIILLTFFTLLLKTWARGYPDFVSAYYTNGLYDFIRWFFDFFSGWLPFAFIYVVLIALIIVLYQAFQKWRKKNTLKEKLLSLSLGLMLLLGGIYTSFTWLWGFNYEKTSFSQHHRLQPVALNDSLLLQELELLAQRLSELRDETGFTDSITLKELPSPINVQVRQSLNDGLRRIGYQPKGKLRAKMLYPKGSLLRLSTAGIFLPFSGEGHIDPGLHPLQIPFVMAHEMSHAQGITNEGVANFLAYYVLAQSDNPKLRYCGLLGYYRYLASQCRRIDSEWYSEFFQSLNYNFKNDLIHIAINGRKYPDLLPKLRDFTYDKYLKAQGIQEGMRSYGTMVRLKHQWEARYGTIDLVD